jgi:hypothetical protein
MKRHGPAYMGIDGGSQRVTDTTAESKPRGWPNWLSWSLVLTVAVIVYELTAQTMLSVAVACSKFGWNDFLSANWLRRVDPVPSRGRTLAWLHTAFGLWKITGAAFLGACIIVLITMPWLLPFGIGGQPQQRANQPDSETFLALTVTISAGIVLSLITGWVGIARAWWCRQRIWLDLRIHRARRANVWPPFSSRHNYFRWMLELTWLLTGVAVMVLAIVVVGTLLGPGVGTAMLLLGIMVGVFFPNQMLSERCRTALVAESAERCWLEPRGDA